MENGALRISRLAIEITNCCNANCSFCAYKYMQRPKYILSNEQFKVFLDKYVEYGGGELKFTPIVGDPLMDTHFIEKIKMARQTGVITHMYTYTNLIGLKNFDIKDLLTSGIGKIDISTCFANKEMYQRLYGVDKYEEVMDNLRELAMMNKKLGIGVKINIFLRTDKPYEEMISSFYYKYFTEVLGCNVRIMENWDNWTGFIKLEDLPKGQVFREIGDMKEPCHLLYKGLIILGNGDVGACWCRDFEGTLIVGNIYQNSLEEIWNGEKLKTLRDNWVTGKIPEVCKNCYQYTSLTEQI